MTINRNKLNYLLNPIREEEEYSSDTEAYVALLESLIPLCTTNSTPVATPHRHCIATLAQFTRQQRNTLAESSNGSFARPIGALQKPK